MKKTKIIITFTENNLPKAKIKNATGAQIIRAAMLLNQYSRVADKKKQNKLVRFIKRLVACIKSRRTVVTHYPRLPQHIQAVR